MIILSSWEIRVLKFYARHMGLQSRASAATDQLTTLRIVWLEDGERWNRTEIM